MGKRNTQKNEAASTKGKKQNKKQVVKEVEEKVLVPQTKKPRKFSQKVRARRKVKESQGSTKLIFARRTFQRLVRKCLEEVAPEKSWRVSANSFYTEGGEDWSSGLIEGDSLVVEARPRDGGFTIETYTLENDGQRLRIEMTIQPDSFREPIELVRYFDRAN